MILFGYLFFCPLLLAQSTDPQFPTPITSNEINGTIKARDLGDPRLTTHFYVFNGGRGDVFINVITRNFDGDIDIFAADTLRPLTKIVVYSDTSDRETGRVIYLRQPQRLIMRIEGRTPNDEPATYQIKFAGSFQPLTEIAEAKEPKLPEVKADENSNVRVNQVGTIVQVKPKQTQQLPDKTQLPKQKKEIKKTPEDKEKTTVEENQPKEKIEVTEKQEETTEEARVETSENQKVESKAKKEKKKEEKRVEVIITETIPKREESQTKPEKTELAVESQPKPEKSQKVKKTSRKEISSGDKNVNPKTIEKKEEKLPESNSLENVRLVVLFKDGSKIERPMNEITRVTVERGILIIVHKNGSVGRYSILEVAKITIE